MNEIDPTKRDAKQVKIERAMCQHVPDWISFLGTCGFPARACAHPFALRLGGTQLTEGLVLVSVYYINTCLGYETFSGHPIQVQIPSPPG